MRPNYSTIEIDVRQLVRQAEQRRKELFKSKPVIENGTHYAYIDSIFFFGNGVNSSV